MTIAIRIDHVGKRYQLGQRDAYRTLRDQLAVSFRRAARADAAQLWALADVCLDVAAGEVVGLIGANGAGKTTLLKILSRITAPTDGRVELYGRVGSLLEVGTGFHPELTGRENIYLNGAILGMSRAEIARNFDAIVAFAEIEPFLETPVKRYSSGMYVRLAFAVAAHLNPEIMLVDEVLAVGDAAFQERCMGRMREISRAGRTVVFVSHNMDSILQLCTRAVWLDRGRVAMDGAVDRVVSAYLSSVRQRQDATAQGVRLEGHPGRRKTYDGLVRLVQCRVVGDGEAGPLRTGGACRIVLGYEAMEPFNGSRVQFTVIFRGKGSQRLASCVSSVSADDFDEFGRQGEVACEIPRLPLLPGSYALDIGCQVAAGWSDMVYEAARIEVRRGTFYASDRLPPADLGECVFDYRWSSIPVEQRVEHG